MIVDLHINIFLCEAMENILEPLNRVLIFLFSNIEKIRLSSGSIKPVINQGFNFKWPQHAFALFGATKERETVAACRA